MRYLPGEPHRLPIPFALGHHVVLTSGAAHTGCGRDDTGGLRSP